MGLDIMCLGSGEDWGVHSWTWMLGWEVGGRAGAGLEGWDWALGGQDRKAAALPDRKVGVVEQKGIDEGGRAEDLTEPRAF